MNKVASLCIVFFSAIAVLVIGKGILIPFVFALLFWFLTREIRFAINKIGFIKKYFANWIVNLLVFVIMILTFGFVANILTENIAELSNSIEKYKPNVDGILKKVGEVLHVDVIKSVQSAIGKFDYSSILASIANSISGILGNAFMIIIYALFLFLEESSFKKKLTKMFTDNTNYKRVTNILAKIEDSISSYLKLKTFVSLLTGTLSFIALKLVGVDSAVFWAFLIFLLNYIPTIGSLIGTVFPAVFCLIQFGTFTPFLVVLIAVGTIQVIVGNYVEPKLFGTSLNLSPLVTILSLAIWGAIWGVTGMILSVPITVMMVIIFSQFESTRPVAIMLSESGEIDEISK